MIIIAFNKFNELINLIDNKTPGNELLIINNCSTDKRYYSCSFNFNIIHLSEMKTLNYINEYIKTTNDLNPYLNDNKLIYLIDDKVNEIFYFDKVFNFNNKKFNFYDIVYDVYRKKYEFADELNNLHKLIDAKYIDNNNINYFSKLTEIGVNDRQSIFIKDFYYYIDQDRTDVFFNTYKNFIIEYIKPLYPSEEKILYQKTPNLRIGFPNLTAIGKMKTDPSEEIVGLHNDGQFGHPIEEINFVIPITEMYDTNSIYYEPTIDHKKDYNSYNVINLKKDNFFMGYLNKLNHYNKINKTGKTRISFDFRIIPYSKFTDTEICSVTSKNKFTIGDYYELI